MTFLVKFLELHNSYREKFGIEPLVLDRQLCELAQAHCDTMKASKKLNHDGYSERLIEIARKASESVGWSPDAEACFKMWVNSPRHERFISDDKHTTVGYGNNGNYWCAIYAT